MPVTPRPRHIAMVGSFGLGAEGDDQHARRAARRGAGRARPPRDADHPALGRSGAQRADLARGRRDNTATSPCRAAETAGIAFRLRAALRAAAPDVVHLFKPKGHAALAVLGLEQRYPLVVDTDDWEGPRRLERQLAPTAAHSARSSPGRSGSTPRHAAAATAASRTLEGSSGASACRASRRDLSAERRHASAGTATGRRRRKRRRQVRAAPRARQCPDDPPLHPFRRVPARRPVAILRAVRERVPDARLLIVGHGLRGGGARHLSRRRGRPAWPTPSPICRGSSGTSCRPTLARATWRSCPTRTR